MDPINVGVIGAGKLGTFHAGKYHRLSDCRLVAVADIDSRKARKTAKKYDAAFSGDFNEILTKVDAVTVATPTSTHYDIALACLKRGIHVLVEKPVCETPEQAKALIAASKDAGVKLQVGHVERFNPAILRANRLINQPLFIEVHRLGNFSKRGTDVDVVLDLMIHDIDLALHYVKSPVTHLSAVGVPVLTKHGDIANVRLEFENGCVANLTASRVSREKTRKFRIFQESGYLSIDLLNHAVTWVKKVNRQVLGRPIILPRNLKVPKKDALEEEVASFVRAVGKNLPVEVTGEDGLKALELANRIKGKMLERLETFARKRR